MTRRVIELRRRVHPGGDGELLRCEVPPVVVEPGHHALRGRGDDVEVAVAIDVTFDAVGTGTTYYVDITATVSATVDAHSVIANTANAAWTSLPGSGTAGNGTGSNTPGAPVLDLDNATLVLSNGNLAGGSLTFTNLDLSNNTLTNPARGTNYGATNYLLLSINTNNGVVTVTFQATGSKTNIAHGAVLQNQTNALGAFPGPTQTGSFILH